MLLHGIDKIPVMMVSSGARAHTIVGENPHQMTAQPSASWKLSAISVPFCSVQTIKVSGRVSQSEGVSSVIRLGGYDGAETLLFLITIFLGDPRLQQYAIGLIFGFDKYSRFLLYKMKKESRVSYAVISFLREADAGVVCARESSGRCRATSGATLPDARLGRQKQLTPSI